MFSPSAWSHVRWFVQSDIDVVKFEWGWIYALIIIGGSLYCAASRFLQPVECALVDRLSRILAGTWSEVNSHKIWQLTSSLVGLTFILNYISGILLAPNVEIYSSDNPLNLFQLVVGVTLILNVSFRIVGFLLALFFLAFIATYSFSISMDYSFEFLGIAMAFLFYRSRNFGLFALRCGLGLQLMVLGIHNKWLNPQLGLEFLQKYHWNFMSLMGWEGFSDLTFVFSAGMAEFCFGLVILLGWSTRLATVTVLSFFTLTASILGLHELIGHLPILGAGILLVAFGGGKCHFLDVKELVLLKYSTKGAYLANLINHSGVT